MATCLMRIGGEPREGQEQEVVRSPFDGTEVGVVHVGTARVVMRGMGA